MASKRVKWVKKNMQALGYLKEFRGLHELYADAPGRYPSKRTVVRVAMRIWRGLSHTEKRGVANKVTWMGQVLHG